jgi:hypothetical protein
MSRTILAAVTAVFVALAAAPLANAATQNTFGGRATVITGTVAGTPVSVVDTGPVQPGGDAVQASLLCYPAAPDCTIGVPDATGGAVRADVFHASAVAGGSRSHATATVADTALNVAGHTIQATFLAADADVSCSNGVASVGGSAEVAELTIDGQTIVVGGQANQSVPLPGGGNVVINEQGTSASANQGSADVSALHVVIPGVLGVGGTDVFVAKAHADAGCAPPPSSTCDITKDFVTGGGWVHVGAGVSRANFAVAGGIKKGLFWGHLEYINHLTGRKVHGLSVSLYEPVSPGQQTLRHIRGLADVNGTTMTYDVLVADNGESGKGVDTFELKLDGAPEPIDPNTLGGGNIQLHHPCPVGGEL